MHICHNCGKQEHIRANCYTYSNPQSGNQYRNPDHQFQTPNYHPNQDQYQPFMIRHVQKIWNTYQKIAGHHAERRIDKTVVLGSYK
ncbi:hypothetical protein G9A89_001298 [Geosiphon pyriformis]|nr:hypothetical protein G9A89_001298 [Geosiphon pyriformis]